MQPRVSCTADLVQTGHVTTKLWKSKSFVSLITLSKARGMVVLFITAAQQATVGVCLDAKVLVCSQEEMLVI